MKDCEKEIMSLSVFLANMYRTLNRNILTMDKERKIGTYTYTDAHILRCREIGKV